MSTITPTIFRQCTALWRIALLSLLMGLSACGGGGGGGGGGGAETPATTTTVIDTTGGTLTGPDGVQVVISAAALNQPTEITITRDAKDAPELGGLRPISSIYAITPHGTQFAESVRISIPFNPADVAPGTQPVIMKAQPGGTWTALVSDVTGNSLAADSSGLSYYAVGTCYTSRDATVPGPDPLLYCPANHSLKLRLQDGFGSSLPVPRTPSGTPLPAITISTLTNLNFNVEYNRPLGIDRSDLLSVWAYGAGLLPSEQPLTGFVANNTSIPAVWITIDPAKVPLAGRPNGVVIRIKSWITYTADAFYPGCFCFKPASWTLEAEVPVRVIYHAPPVPPVVTHTIGGSVSGLTGSGLVLRNNGGDNRAVTADGAFTFATPVNAASAYNVTVFTQPTGQTCTVQNGSGTASANVTNVAVSCVAILTYTIGGSVSGLTGTGLVLHNNGGDNQAVTADGAFTFTTPISAGSTYNVSVFTQPTGQTCTVQNSSGMVNANVTNVLVSCTVNTGVPLVASAIAAGNYNSLVVASNGTVYAWGYLVDATTGGYSSAGPWAAVPVLVQGLAGVKGVALSAESNAFYALHTDGTVSAWGLNDVGQLGDRTTTTRALPVKVMQDATTPMDEVCSISASASILFMVRQTGCSPGQRPINYGPWIVGLFSGQNFGGANNTAVLPFNGSIAKLASGWPVGQTQNEAVSGISTPDAANTKGAAYISTAKNDKYMWGDNGGNRLGFGTSVLFAGSSAGPVQPPDGLFWSGFNRIEFGRDFSIGLDETSHLQGVGRNLEGQLGNGNTTASSSLVPVLVLANVSTFSVGQVSVAAITGGQLWAWGWNGNSAITQPTRLGTGTGFTKVSVGDVHSLAIGPGGEVYSWGDGTYGALGNGSASGNLSIPTVVLRP